MSADIENILCRNVGFLTVQLTIMTNVQLLEDFKKQFSILNDYKPLNEEEKIHILEFSKCYIDEFQFRLKHGSAALLQEFAKLMQQYMKNDKSIGATYYTRNLLRLYSYTINIMQEKGIPQNELKKNFL